MSLTVRWLAALAFALLATACSLFLFVVAAGTAGGNAEAAFTFGLSAAAFAGVLVGTVKAPKRHRKWALWFFIVLVCIVPGAALIQALAGGEAVAPELWRQMLATLAGAFLARIVARNALQGFGDVFFYPPSTTDAWLLPVSAREQGPVLTQSANVTYLYPRLGTA